MERRIYRETTLGRLSRLGIEVPDHLPMIEDDDGLKPRDKDAVVGRIAALGHVIGMGYTKNTRPIVESIERYGLWPWICQSERERLEDPDKISEQDAIDFQWFCEGAYALAWCLKILPLDPSRGCPDNLAALTVPGHTPDEFSKGREMRPLTEIQQEADFYYCLHWYEKQCSLTGEDGLLGWGAAWERRRALDWVIGVGEDWYEIPRDT